MNFNPFAQNKSIVKGFRRYPAPIDMYDRTVGRREQMGVFDYLLLAPAVIKTLMFLTHEKSTPAYVSLVVLSIPFSLVKLALYCVGSPIIGSVWAIKEAVKKKKISPYTLALNSLTVKTNLANIATALVQVKQLHDGDLRTHSIRAKDNELVLTSLSGQVVATIEKTRQNITLLQSLHEGVSRNRMEYFFTQVGNNIIDYSALTLIDAVDKYQASSYVKMVDQLLVKSNVDDSTQLSFAHIPRDVRHLIAREFLRQECVDPAFNPLEGQFTSFSPEVRHEAAFDYINTAARNR